MDASRATMRITAIKGARDLTLSIGARLRLWLTRDNRDIECDLLITGFKRLARAGVAGVNRFTFHLGGCNTVT
jgi:hypothetical protein